MIGVGVVDEYTSFVLGACVVAGSSVLGAAIARVVIGAGLVVGASAAVGVSTTAPLPLSLGRINSPIFLRCICFR